MCVHWAYTTAHLQVLCSLQHLGRINKKECSNNSNQYLQKGFYTLFHLQFITFCHYTTVTSIGINCHLSVNLVLAVPLHSIALRGQPATLHTSPTSASCMQLYK